MKKYDIVNGLAREFKLCRYLEIVTPTTGGEFRKIKSHIRTSSHRLMYRCPDDYDDGLPLTYRTKAENSYELIRQIGGRLTEAEKYDIIFVDPYHTYDCTNIDIYGAMSVLRPGGIVVVHDCNPTGPDIATEENPGGTWCGVTYQAFVDFVLSGQIPNWCTVDSDYGCGVLFNRDVPSHSFSHKPFLSDRLVLEWENSKTTKKALFPVFERNRKELLNLVAPKQFSAEHAWVGVEAYKTALSGRHVARTVVALLRNLTSSKLTYPFRVLSAAVRRRWPALVGTVFRRSPPPSAPGLDEEKRADVDTLMG